MLDTILIIIKILVAIFGLIAAGAAAFGAVARIPECIYQLKQHPELDTFGKSIQFVKNYFTVEKYQ
jgi:hypothetical protein